MISRYSVGDVQSTAMFRQHIPDIAYTALNSLWKMSRYNLPSVCLQASPCDYCCNRRTLAVLYRTLLRRHLSTAISLLSFRTVEYSSADEHELVPTGEARLTTSLLFFEF
jgi:hypothetical protein